MTPQYNQITRLWWLSPCQGNAKICTTFHHRACRRGTRQQRIYSPTASLAWPMVCLVVGQWERHTSWHGNSQSVSRGSVDWREWPNAMGWDARRCAKLQLNQVNIPTPAKLWVTVRPLTIHPSIRFTDWSVRPFVVFYHLSILQLLLCRHDLLQKIFKYIVSQRFLFSYLLLLNLVYHRLTTRSDGSKY